MRTDVVPAILAKSEEEFVAKLHAIEREAKLVHIDVMDGRFVPNTTWADPLVVGKLRTPAKFEVHLMVEEPFREVILWGKLAQVRRTVVHVEATTQLRTLLHTIRATGKEVGIAVNPSTRISNLESRISGDADAILVMANEPGFAGRPFHRATLKRIAALRAKFSNLPIGVDIGVDAETAPFIRAAGATFACAGSAIFGAPDPVAAYRAILRAFRS